MLNSPTPDSGLGSNQKPNFVKRGGLIIVIVQDSETKEVLGHGFVNKESYRLTVETRELWLWTTSRKELWPKGATTGNVCRVMSLAFDCDRDCVLVGVLVEGNGWYCHKKRHSCFVTVDTNPEPC